MPLARYLVFVGGVLLALLFASDAFLPSVPVADKTETDLPVIRIQSDRKWPERVVLDTTIPTIVPPPGTQAAASAPAPTAPADDSAKTREAFAQAPSADAPRAGSSDAKSSDAKKPEPKPQRKRKIARSRTGPPPMMVAQQPRFGFFDFGTW